MSHAPLSFPLEPQPPRDAPAPREPRTPGAPHEPGRARRIGRRVLRAGVAVLLGYYLFCLVLLAAYRFVNPPITGVQLERRVEAAADGRWLRVQRKYAALDEISPHLAHAVVAAEDGRFWTHWGYDFTELRAAGLEALAGERARGASTITQQLAKNLFGCTCRNPLRKVNDLVLAFPTHLVLGRERVLELYLNNVEWGPGIFGAEAAARHYFHRSARDLSRRQSAALAALLPNPLRRTPHNTPEYRGEILDRMDAHGW